MGLSKAGARGSRAGALQGPRGPTCCNQMVGGLRSGMGYCASLPIQQLQCDVEMVQITSAGPARSHPHGRDHHAGAPNYRA